MPIRLAIWFALAGLLPACAVARPLSIVAAENVYGDVTQQLAGGRVTVRSIMSNPDQDPHLFEASPSVARLLSDADIVIYNGAGYDPWVTKLLSASHAPNCTIIVVAQLVRKVPGDNPHLWYDPATMPVFAKALAATLEQRDPAHHAEYDESLHRFLDTLQSVQVKIQAIRAKFAGAPVTATEPVFGYMAAALGLRIFDERFQIAVMNGAEPRASEIATMEDGLRSHRVHLLLFNSQANDPAAQRMVGIARRSHVPVVGVTETEPPGRTYQQWMADQLDAVERALSQ